MFLNFRIARFEWLGKDLAGAPAFPATQLPPAAAGGLGVWFMVAPRVNSFFKTSEYGGFHCHGGTPIARWMVLVREIPYPKNGWWVGVPLWLKKPPYGENVSTRRTVLVSISDLVDKCHMFFGDLCLCWVGFRGFPCSFLHSSIGTEEFSTALGDQHHNMFFLIPT